MTIALCILLFGAGHLLRDGWPPIGHTNLGARPAGGALCVLGGALAMMPWWHGAILGGAVFIGFWTDQQHAAGQGARTATDAMWLAVSGVTSLIPLACAAAWFFGLPFLALAAIGLAKVPIWFSWMRSPIQSVGPWFQPTRVAAISFGLTVGAIVALLL